MAESLKRADVSTPVHSVDDVRTGGQLKAELGPSRSIPVQDVVKDALERHYGSLKAAAISLDVDSSQLSRELRTGAFQLEKLERADDEAKAFIANALREAYGDPDPKARAQRLIREARQRLDALAEVVA